MDWVGSPSSLQPPEADNQQQAQSLGQKARQRFRCPRNNDGSFVVPSEYIIRDVLIRVDPVQLDQALQRWNETYGEKDQLLAIDGKTMCNALDKDGCQTHINKRRRSRDQNLPCPKKVGTLPVENVSFAFICTINQ